MSEVPGEGHYSKLQPGPVICVQSPCPVSFLVLQKALNPLPSFESHDMSSLRMWARVRPALRLTLLLTWPQLTFPTPATPHVSYSSRFNVLHAGLTLVEVRCLHRACLYLRALLTTSTSCSHISPSLLENEKQLSQNLTVWLFYYLMFTTHPTPKWMCKGFPGGTLLRNPPASSRCRIPWVWEDPLRRNEQPTPDPCLENFMDRSLVGKESDMTEHIRLWLQLCTSKCKRRPN